MLKLYHAEPGANSLKCLIPLKEKALPFQSAYVDLHRFEQHEPWFLAINPEGQVPVLDHDGVIVTQSTVINAATVIGRTATSASNFARGARSASIRRRAGSASFPVTNRIRGRDSLMPLL